MIEGKTIAVWFSCGAASAVAAKKTIEKYGKNNRIRVINNPIREEDEDNMRFLRDVEKWLNVDIEFAVNSKWPSYSTVDVWEKKQFMAGKDGAPCTSVLKKDARYEWEKNNPCDYMVLGFTIDEWQRAWKFRSRERDNLLPVLIHEMLTKDDCFRIIRDAGLKLPRIYEMGYPNANCIGCVKASSPTYWNHVRKMHPDIFEERAKQSREIGAKLVRVKNQRMFLDELAPDAIGRPMKGMDFECGIFCEER